MHSRRIWIGTGFLCLGLVSCAVMSPQECQLANWREIGRMDGLAGKPLAFFDERRNECAEADVHADTQGYLSGREQGLRSYCQIGNALQLGLRGESYEGVCPPPMDPEFRRRHRIGFDVHRFREEVAQLDNRSESLERRLHSREHELERHLNDADKNDERRHLRQEFENEQHRIREEQRDIDRSLQRARDQLRAAEWAMDQLR